jgi:hypothetical protein
MEQPYIKDAQRIESSEEVSFALMSEGAFQQPQYASQAQKLPKSVFMMQYRIAKPSVHGFSTVY